MAIEFTNKDLPNTIPVKKAGKTAILSSALFSTFWPSNVTVAVTRDVIKIELSDGTGDMSQVDAVILDFDRILVGEVVRAKKAA